MAAAEDGAGTTPFRGQGDGGRPGAGGPAGPGPAPLRLRVDTTDLDVANGLLREAYATADISAPRDDPAFEYQQELEGDEELNLGRFRIRGHGRVSVQLEDTVAVARVRVGGHDWDVDGFRGTGLVLVQPHQPYRSILDLVTADTVNFRLAALHRTALDVYGAHAGDVVFDHPRPADRARERYWKTTHDFVRRALTDPAVASAPLLRADLLRRMAVATLECFPRGSGEARPRRCSTAARAAVCRQAVAFMRDVRGLPITLEDVARHTGLSTVELSRAFRAHHGTTPGNVLRELRLEAAHEDLRRGTESAGDTVRDVALRWGFPDPGDFVRRYRRTYGVYPAATLRAPARARRR